VAMNRSKKNLAILGQKLNGSQANEAGRNL
jgi:hypothetical protein